MTVPISPEPGQPEPVSVPFVPGRPEEPFTLAQMAAPRTGSVPPVTSSFPPGYAPGVTAMAPGARSSRRRNLIIVAAALAVAVLAAGGAVGYVLVSNVRDARPVVGASDDLGSRAIKTCENAVLDRLKAPATARFSEERVTGRDGTYVIVAGSVDAENGFGALLRNHYVCRVDNGELVNVDFDHE